MYPEGSGDLGVLRAFLRKGVDGFEVLLCLLSRALLRSFAVQAEVRQSSVDGSSDAERGPDLVMLPEHSRNHISEVLQEVEAVGYLHGARSDHTYGLGVLAATACSPPRPPDAP